MNIELAPIFNFSTKIYLTPFQTTLEEEKNDFEPKSKDFIESKEVDLICPEYSQNDGDHDVKKSNWLKN